MKDSEQFTLPIQALPALASLVEVSPTRLSPLFGNGEEGSEAAEALKSSGLVKSGRVKESIQKVITKLANTQSMAVLRYTAGDAPLILISCFDDPEGSPVSIHISGEQAIIEDPANMEGMLVALSEMMGTSAMRSSDLDLVLELEDIPVWLALADARRIAHIEALMGRQTDESLPFSLVSGKALVGLRLLNLIPGEEDEAEEIKEKDFQEGLSRLEKKGLAVKSESGWRLSDAAEKCMGRLLIPDSVTTLQTRRLIEGEVIGIALSYIQSGVNDILAMETVTGGLQVWSESPAGALLQISLLMQRGDQIPLPTSVVEPVVPISAVPPPVPLPPRAGETVCESCKKPVSSGTKFCPFCGTPIQAPSPVPPKPTICGKCGKPVMPGAKFCGSCGEKT